MPSVDTLIWIACRPLLRLLFCIGSGVIITKADLFPSIAAQGAAQILLNVLYPCLMFSKIIPVFTSENLTALGPLVLVALLYQVMGALLAWIVKQFFWVPHRFRYGIIVAGVLKNVADIPSAVVLSLVAFEPFGGPKDQSLAVAYISMFFLVFVATLFPLGSHRLITWDYVGPDVEPEDVQASMKKKWSKIFSAVRHIASPREREKDPEDQEMTIEHKDVQEVEDPVFLPVLGIESRKEIAFADDATTTVAHETPMEIGVAARARQESTDRWVQSTFAGAENKFFQPHQPTSDDETSNTETKLSPGMSLFWVTWGLVLEFFRRFSNPPCVAVIASFHIALIPPLKALFVPVPGVDMPSAPDGQPPLAVFVDIAAFVGAATVPLGLICLGSSLARLSFPKKGEWGMLPLGAISSLAVGKMLIMPVIGVVACEGLTRVGIIPREDKVLRLVCTVCSCLPTAMVQVLLTQVYSGTGTAEHLSAFLIPQYLLMLFSLPTLIAYTLRIMF